MRKIFKHLLKSRNYEAFILMLKLSVGSVDLVTSYLSTLVYVLHRLLLTKLRL